MAESCIIFQSAKHLAMELSDTELAGMNTLHDAALWAGLGGEPRNSLFSHLGVEGTTPVRNIGILSRDDYSAIIASWTLPAPTTEAPTATTPRTAKSSRPGWVVGARSQGQVPNRAEPNGNF